MTKSLEECNQKALKTGFVEIKDNQVLCQLSIKILANCQLSVNPIQTLIISCQFTINRQYAQLILTLTMSLVIVFRKVGHNNLI